MLSGAAVLSAEVENAAGDLVSQELIVLFEKCKKLHIVLTDKECIGCHDVTSLAENEKESVENTGQCFPSGSSITF